MNSLLRYKTQVFMSLFIFASFIVADWIIAMHLPNAYRDDILGGIEQLIFFPLLILFLGYFFIVFRSKFLSSLIACIVTYITALVFYFVFLFLTRLAMPESFFRKYMGFGLWPEFNLWTAIWFSRMTVISYLLLSRFKFMKSNREIKEISSLTDYPS